MLFFDSKDKQTVTISPSIVVFTVFFLMGLVLLFVVRDVLISLFLAFIIMTALRPAVDKLNLKFKVPRLLSIAVVYLVVLSCLFGLVAVVVPPLTSQVYNLLKDFDFPFLQQQIKDLKLTVNEISSLISQFGNGAGIAWDLVNSTFGIVLTFFTTLVMSVYLMLDRDNLYKKANWFTRESKNKKLFKEFLDMIEVQLGGWIRGQLLLMLTIGVVTFIGLSLLGIPFALPLAILAGFMEILPNLGPTLSAVPAVLLAMFTMSPLMGGVVAIFYILVQQVENNFLVPKIMQANADVNPLVAIVTILIGFKLGGVMGALLSIPIYIVLRASYSIMAKVRHNWFC